jgi:hypothetical protein
MICAGWWWLDSESEYLLKGTRLLESQATGLGFASPENSPYQLRLVWEIPRLGWIKTIRSSLSNESFLLI